MCAFPASAGSSRIKFGRFKDERSLMTERCPGAVTNALFGIRQFRGVFQPETSTVAN